MYPSVSVGRGRVVRAAMLVAVVGASLAWADEQENPLIPMGAITGRPDEATVRETLEAYKAVGIDQYLIYARSGLELEYMGEEWLQMCEWFAAHAKRLGMTLWLYDEYNWPSGSCKGKVPAENPDFESRQYAVYRDGAGKYIWRVIHSPGWVDNYNFRAMERFIELTHKRYEERLGPYLGSTIKGIFTDEPAHPVPMKAEGKPAVVFRYFDGAEEEYRAAAGRELRADVEAYLDNGSRDEVWAVYGDLLGTRFRRAYFDPIRAWCDRVGVFSTGHMISENDTSNSALYNGHPLRAIKGLTLPGIDEIGTRVDPDRVEWATLAIGQHAIGRRGKGGLAELFALGPSDMTHATQRQMIWLSALHKVDRYLLAIAPLDARGNAEKAGYLNAFTPMQPWFPALRLLGDEARIAARWAARPARCDIAIRYPQRESARLSARRQSHPALLPTLRRFSARQITYDLYEEDEPCDKMLIFGFSGTALRDERSGRTFQSPDEAADFALEKCPPALWVEKGEGVREENVLLRQYEDGSAAVLALGTNSFGSLRLMRRGGSPVPFELPAQGVFLFEGKAPSTKSQPRKVEFPKDARYRLALGGRNACRLPFGPENAMRLKVEDRISAVRIVARHFPEQYVVSMDGRNIETEASCDSLRPGFNELCRQSGAFDLEAGEHEFSIAAGGSDTNYFLPVAWLCGDFAVEGKVLRQVPRSVSAGPLCAQGLGNFAGTVTYATSIDVPSGGRVWLSLDTGGLFTAIAMDGEDLGERAWAPFEWEVPVRLKGKKAELRITVATSVAPLFGDWKDPAGSWPKKFWVPPRAEHPEIGLLVPPQWLVEE